MRTIDKILGRDKLTSSEKQYYFEHGIINGCGGKGDSLEKIMKDIGNLTEYDDKYVDKLIEDINEISYCHDIDYYDKNGFYKSNFLFAYRLARLINFTDFISRFLIFVYSFIILNKYGKKYYNLKE